MVSFHEGQAAALNAIQDAQRKEVLMAQLVEADLRIADLLQEEPDSVVAYDYEHTWRPKITAAINDGRHQVNNFPWLWFSRGSDEYVRALQETLGSLGNPFTVGQDRTVWGNEYTRVIW